MLGQKVVNCLGGAALARISTLVCRDSPQIGSSLDFIQRGRETIGAEHRELACCFSSLYPTLPGLSLEGGLMGLLGRIGVSFREEKNVFILEGTKSSGFSGCCYGGSPEERRLLAEGATRSGRSRGPSPTRAFQSTAESSVGRRS